MKHIYAEDTSFTSGAYIINKIPFMTSPFQADVVYHPFSRDMNRFPDRYIILIPSQRFNSETYAFQDTLKIRLILWTQPYPCL